MASHIMGEIIDYGGVRRGYLGISTQDLSPELARAFGMRTNQGAVVARVVPGSVGEEAGLQVGDVITAIEGRAIKNTADLRNAVGLARVGETIDLTVQRDGAETVINVRVRPPEVVTIDAAEIHAELTGALLHNINESSPLFGRISGVLVGEVVAGTPAWNNGLRGGDVIVSLNRRPLDDIAQLTKLADSGRRMLLQIRRGDRALFLLLE
jgi:serine protease Do/serine protease DegQ